MLGSIPGGIAPGGIILGSIMAGSIPGGIAPGGIAPGGIILGSIGGPPAACCGAPGAGWKACFVIADRRSRRSVALLVKYMLLIQVLKSCARFFASLDY